MKRILLFVVMFAGLAYGRDPFMARRLAVWDGVASGVVTPFPTNGLVTYLSMDSILGVTVFDTWASNDAVAENSPQSVSGKYLNALNFNGTNQRLALGARPRYDFMHGRYDTVSFQKTISFWIKINELPPSSTWEAIISTAAFTADGRGFHVAVFSDGGIVHDIVNGRISGTRVCVNSTSAGSLSVSQDFTHIAITYDHALSSENSKIYINGILTSVATKQGNPTSLTSTFNALLASYPEANYLNCAIDELAIFSRSLSSNEVYQIATTPLFYTP